MFPVDQMWAVQGKREHGIVLDPANRALEGAENPRRKRLGTRGEEEVTKDSFEMRWGLQERDLSRESPEII